MKLPDFTTIFRDLFEEMGIDKVLDEIDIRLSSTEGIEVDCNDPNLLKLSDGLFYRGRRILVYIRDQYISSQYSQNGGFQYRFHICYCRTLKDMEEKGRFESRYVATTNTSGSFKVNLIDRNGLVIEKGIEKELRVCRNCLRWLNYKNYNHKDKSEREEIFQSFSIDEFFKLYGRFIGKAPRRDEFSPSINIYSRGWNQISERYKRKTRWKCEECGIDLSEIELRKFLEVHHKDGDKSNNSEDNLIALCIKCHARQPYHDHIRSTSKYNEFEKIFRSITASINSLSPGDLVEHPKFGIGRIITTHGRGLDTRVVVEFNGVVKTLMAKSARLRRI